MAAMDRLKDPPTWLKVATTQEIDLQPWPPRPLGATARSYRRQDGANAAARFEKFLPARASLRPPISLKIST